jgi:hypothetical protein
MKTVVSTSSQTWLRRCDGKNTNDIDSIDPRQVLKGVSFEIEPLFARHRRRGQTNSERADDEQCGTC